MDAARMFAMRAAYVPGSTIAWGTLRDGQTVTGSTGREHDGQCFPIASITKVLTATLLVLLVRRDIVRFDTSVAGLVDLALPPAVGEITLHDLATHTSGLPRLPPAMRRTPDPSDPYASYDRAALLGFLAATMEGAILDGRGVFEYSNFGVGLLGTLLAIAAGRDYAALLHEEIFKPLGMHDSFVHRMGANAPRTVVAGMDADGTPVPTWRHDAFAPAGGVVSTVDDLLILVDELLTGTSPLSEALRETTVQQHTPRFGPGVGLCWMCQKNVRWHNGGTYGHHAMLAVDLHERAAAVALWNTPASLDDICLHLVDASSPLVDPPAEIALPAEHLERFSGIYDVQSGGTITIELDGSRLWLNGTVHARCRLYARGEQAFFSKLFPGATFAFTVNEAGDVVTLEQTMAGFTIVRAQRRAASDT